MLLATAALDRPSALGLGRPTPPPMPAISPVALAPAALASAAAKPPAEVPLKDARLLVSFATFNEAENIRDLIAAVHAIVPHAHVLVVDDNSPDGTGRIADELAAADPRVHVLHRPRKLGLGTATLAAMRYAIEHKYDYLQNMDADFSHPPRFLAGILGGMKSRDVMVGSRYTPGGGTENWPLARQAMSQCVNGLVRFLFRMPVADASGAYRCYRVSTLAKADLHLTQSRGYSFQQEVLFRCHRAGARLGEFPIIFENRRAGRSKVNWKEAVRSLGMIVWIGTHHFFGLESYKPKG